MRGWSGAGRPSGCWARDGCWGGGWPSEGGSELAVGILGEGAGRWRTGELAALLRGWLAARRDREPEPAAVECWTGLLDPHDQAWVLNGPRPASLLAGRRPVLI